VKIYLAGKISKRDWRWQVVRGVDALDRYGLELDQYNHDTWPVLERAIFGTHDYVGPYFISCNHGCFHGDNAHGVGAVPKGCADPSGGHDDIGDPALVVEKCLTAIDRADFVFAWLDDPTAYGTIFELGYAKGRKIPVAYASPVASDPRTADLWFTKWAMEGINAPTPAEGLNIALQYVAPRLPRPAPVLVQPPRPNREKVPPRLRFQILRRDAFRCTYCGAHGPNVRLEVDHVHPRALGGTNDPGNLVTACFDCNRGKRDKEIA
jgi:hypothetical protein